MALRIGALILATCNLLNASILDHRDYRHVEEPISVSAHKEGLHPILFGNREVLPTPGIIVGNYNIGGSEKRHEAHSDQKDHESRSEGPSKDSEINIKSSVSFKPLKYEKDSGSKDQKAPITIVTVPRVSTAPPTKHEVVDNHVKNESNLPEHKDPSNESAKKELLSYDNLLKTSIKPVKEVRKVEESSKESNDHNDHSHKQYPTVKPSTLQRYADKQIAFGEAREYATPVIKTFTVSAPHHDHDDEKLHRDWNDWHKDDHKDQPKEQVSRERKEKDSKEEKVVTKSLNIVVHQEKQKQEAHDWQKGWLGNGKQ